MRSIEDYITEAISSGKYRGLSKPSEELLTSETNFDDFCTRLEECGVNWKPIKGPDVVPDKEFLENAIRTWNWNYDVFMLKSGITVMVIVTKKDLFKFTWSTKSQNKSGPAYGGESIILNGKMYQLSDDLEETLATLNGSLSKDLF